MCGRYASVIPADFLGRLFGTVNPLPNLQPRWNMSLATGLPDVRSTAQLPVTGFRLVNTTPKAMAQGWHPARARHLVLVVKGSIIVKFPMARCGGSMQAQ